jgi:hypothetical protein
MQISLVPMPISKLTVYLVLDDLGKRGRVWCEIDEARANEQALIDDILSGQYERPLRVVAFDVDEGWACDVTKEIAAKLLDVGMKGRSLGAKAWEFIERVTAGATTVN